VLPHINKNILKVLNIHYLYLVHGNKRMVQASFKFNTYNTFSLKKYTIKMKKKIILKKALTREKCVHCQLLEENNTFNLKRAINQCP